MPTIPSGTVVFLFTDIEGSTARWDAHREAMQRALRRHDELLREAIESHGGYVFKTIGDAFCAAFDSAAAAIAAAAFAQRALAAEDFSSVDGLRVRMAIHAGETDERGGDYFGPAVNRVARMLPAGHGGQVLASNAVAEMASGSLADGTALRLLGTLPLRDLKEPERVFQLVAPGLETEFKELRALETPPNNLPHQATSFVGRQDDLARIEELLRHNALVTVAGTGGSGKTRVALAAARNVLNDRRDGAWFVDLAPIADPALVVSAILTTLGADQSGGTPGELLLSHLAKRDVLLILDNCEHVVAEVARVAGEIVARAPHVTILATSRELLGVTGERIHRLGSLDRDSAAALFIDRAKAVNPQFSADGAAAALIDDICTRLDGTAFAIELAAARVRTLSLEELSRRLELRLLAGGRDRLPRQQTMRAVIDWGHDVLGDDEKALFRRLSVFAGGCTLEAATAVCGDEPLDDIAVLDGLTTLADKSMLVFDQDAANQRYRLLELMRQYAHEKLDAAGETDAIRSRHARASADMANAGYEEWDTDPRTDWLQRHARELDNFRAALAWSIGEARDVALGAELAASIAPVFMRLSLLREAVDWCERARDAAVQLAPHVEARLHYALSMLYSNLGAQTETLAAATRASDLYRETGDARSLARALWQIAAKLALKQEYEAAQRAAAESIELARSSGDRRFLARALQHCAWAYAKDIEKARAFLGESVTIFRALGRNDETARALMWWAQTEAEEGHYDTAVSIAEEALDIADEAFKMFIVAGVAGYLVASGDRAKGEVAAREALQLSARQQHAVATAVAVLYSAVWAAESAPDDAARMLGYAERQLEQERWVLTGYDAAAHQRLHSELARRLPDESRIKLIEEGAAWTPDRALRVISAL